MILQLLVAACLSCLLSFPLFAAEDNWQAPLRAELNAMADKLGAELKPWPVPARAYSVEDYGAVADGQTVNTAALQKAIDACSAAGGGVVRLTKGDYVSGTIELKDGVMLQVDKDARLLGSLHLADYPDKPALHPTVMDSHYHLKNSLIFAEGRQRIGICGEGTIDGRGSKENFPGPNGAAAMPGRPFLIRMIECRQVVMSAIHLRNSAGWMQNYLNCEDVILQGLNVFNQANWNNDGVDLDGCRNALVRDCLIDSQDDGLCFKGAGLRTMENVLVENCKIQSWSNAVKFGTDSQGGFRNVLIRNVQVGGPDRAKDDPEGRKRAISGFSWESVDGGVVENILVSNARIVRADSPLFVYRGKRGRVMPGMAAPGAGRARRMIFEHLSGQENGGRGSAFVGTPGAPVEDVAVNDCKLSADGGGSAENAAAALKERANAYPESNMFGSWYPASGFYVWHAKGVRLTRVTVTLNRPDARPSVSAGPDTEDLTLDGTPLPEAKAP